MLTMSLKDQIGNCSLLVFVQADIFTTTFFDKEFNFIIQTRQNIK